MFQDRAEAGRILAERLAGGPGERSVILALPRGGVPVGFEIARALGAPLDLVLVRKIGAPFQQELAIGAVVDGEQPEIVRESERIAEFGLSEAYIEAEAARQFQEIARRRAAYLGGRRPVGIAGRTVVLVDDGIATGATMRAALRAVRRRAPARLILAVPVAAPETVEALRPEVDEVICLEMPEPLVAIGLHYRDFRQLDDGEVVALLDRAAAGRKSERPRGAS